MMHTKSTFAFCLLLILIVISIHSESSAELQENNATKADAEELPNPEFSAVKQAVEKFVTAYNAGEADKLAELFTESAELIDLSDTAYRGREVILAEYQAFFKTHPEASMQIVVDEVKFVAPNVAIEAGRAESKLSPEAIPVFSQYQAVYAKVDGQWLLSHVKEEDLVPESGAKLEELSWLIGQWVDESEDSQMSINCYWHESGSYLIRDFEVKIEGLLASRGTERIGWDPLQQKVRSWLFDSAGGHLGGTWVKQGERWTIATDGYRPDGVPTHATYIVTPLRDDSYHLVATSRTAGEEQLDDFEMTIVKRPPTPGDVPTLKTTTER